MIKVLMVVTSLTTDGVTSYAMNYFRKLDREFIHMDFVILRPDIAVESIIKEVVDRGSKVYSINFDTGIRENIKKCYEIFKEDKYDIVHNNTLILSYFIMRGAQKACVPIRILHSHNSCLGETKKKEFRNKLLIPFLKKTATAYVACSEAAARGLFGEKKIDVLPNVIDSKRYIFDSAIRQQYRIEYRVNKKQVIITVGRLSEQKNPFFAIDIFKYINDRNKDTEYWWIGDGPLKADVQEYINRNGLTEAVKLLGNRLDIAELYMAADVFFLPSKFEGLPITAIEAQAVGLPCILSDKITKELVYTDLVTYVSLESDKEEWINKISISHIDRRSMYHKDLDRSIFSSQYASNNLINFYQKLIDTKNLL